METEIIKKKIETIESLSANGNKTLLLEKFPLDHLKIIKNDLKEFDEGVRNIEKWEGHISLIDLDHEHINKIFDSIIAECSDIFDEIKNMAPIINGLINDIESKNYNINNIFYAIRDQKENQKILSSRIAQLESLYPHVYQEKNSTSNCILFYLALVDFKLKSCFSQFPENIAQMDLEIKLVSSILDILAKHVLGTIEKEKSNQLSLLISQKNQNNQDFEFISNEISGFLH